MVPLKEIKFSITRSGKEAEVFYLWHALYGRLVRR